MIFVCLTPALHVSRVSEEFGNSWNRLSIPIAYYVKEIEMRRTTIVSEFSIHQFYTIKYVNVKLLNKVKILLNKSKFS